MNFIKREFETSLNFLNFLLKYSEKLKFPINYTQRIGVIVLFFGITLILICVVFALVHTMLILEDNGALEKEPLILGIINIVCALACSTWLLNFNKNLLSKLRREYISFKRVISVLKTYVFSFERNKKIKRGVYAMICFVLGLIIIYSVLNLVSIILLFLSLFLGLLLYRELELGQEDMLLIAVVVSITVVNLVLLPLAWYYSLMLATALFPFLTTRMALFVYKIL